MSVLNHRRLHVYHFISGLLPDGTRFRDLRVKLLRWCGATIGDDVYFSKTVRFEGGGELFIGDHTWIGPLTFISCASTHETRASVKIGKNCMIAHMVSIKTRTHVVNPLADCIGDAVKAANIEIGDGTWICAGAIVIPGVKVGIKNVLAAGAVVTKSTPGYVLMAGVPAVVKKNYR